MPSSVTHNFFSHDVYEKLNKNIKSLIKPCLNEYAVFAQGPDPYFFYDFHLTRRSKEVSKINKAMQHTLINNHFITLINYIKDNNYYSNPMVMAYLYGQVCHYALDTTCHPYIIYYAGMYDEKDKDTYKYNGLHEEMEYYIDCYFIWNRKHILPKNYKVYKNIFCKMYFNKEIKDVIDTVTGNVYGFSDVSNKYYKSIKDMKKFYYVFNYDKYGIKKRIYRIMDKLCPGNIIRKEELSFHIDPNSKLYYLNIKKETWYHPCNKNESYNYSFFELYDIALNKAASIITEID
ncbi:MAG: hypothetical protein IKN46_02155, partial [Acholeplasmatales bacterium]|nr:hypothetical protein [Acholeplasmatales bacterium]